jgi:uncharacterized membrane protein YccC
MLTRADWLFALKTFAAAMLALYLALIFDLPRPYWAMASVYVAAQPLAGATRSKALYRLVGTVVGASFSVLVVPVLVNVPELLTLAVALWTGLCLYLSLLDRTPRSYVFMLSGYTAALIVFPAVAEPGTIFDTALARVEEITLGILCASLVSTLILPRRAGPAFETLVRAWLRDAERAACSVLALGERAAVRGEADRFALRLGTDIAAIDGLTAHLAFDAAHRRGTMRWVAALRQRMLLLVPLLSSLGDRLAALEAEQALTPALRTLLADVAAWVERAHAAPRASAEALRAEILRATPVLRADAAWVDILRANLMVRLRELVDLTQDCRTLERHIAKGWGHLHQPLAYATEASSRRHVDHGLALLSGAGAATSVLLTGAAWILTGWSDGGNAVVMAAVACSFFSTQDDPAPGILTFARWTVVSVLAVGAYIYAVFPAIHAFPVLVVALAPYFLIVGLLVARPATGMIGMILGANGATFLAIQSGFQPDFAGFANSSLATVLGMWSAAVLMRLYRSIGVEHGAARLVRAGRRTIAEAAERTGRGDRARFASLMVDRLALIVPRLALLAADAASTRSALLSDLRVGLNVVALRHARHGLGRASVAAIDAVLAPLARHYRGAGAPAPMLRARIDAALRTLVADTRGPPALEAMTGLVGLRRGLFPDAPAPAADAAPEVIVGGRIAA